MAAVLKSVTAGPDGSAIPEPSASVLRQVGVSRRAWNLLDAQEKIDLLVQRVARDKDKQVAIAAMPEEPEHLEGSDSPVVYFRKTFGGSKPGESYEYSAIHVLDRGWIVTSQQRLGHMTWAKLLQFVLLREPVGTAPVLWIATDWNIIAAE